ncbi:hypothetical protein BCR44DRAFT_196646 [Catenaria anguillulae PL171]|uniref:Uncharacterized protein n=1 Tax=Catenaria anguillulae PL171 TaxID=765915 RepID=A0A1Y2HMK0_9FUNG|nr:hypothetical protein BCR44DRAFT_196646 [Catenaria anguillulae PL171]
MHHGLAAGWSLWRLRYDNQKASVVWVLPGVSGSTGGGQLTRTSRTIRRPSHVPNAVRCPPRLRRGSTPSTNPLPSVRIKATSAIAHEIGF